jgi:hypothetical protein
MPPPARTAVTVAPPTGAFAAFVTTPTMVPAAAAPAGAPISSAKARGAAATIDATDKTNTPIT